MLFHFLSILKVEEDGANLLSLMITATTKATAATKKTSNSYVLTIRI